MCVPAHDQRDFEFAEKYEFACTSCDPTVARRRAARRTHAGSVYRVWTRGGIRFIYWAHLRSGDCEDGGRRQGERFRRGGNNVPLEGLGNFATALLGYAYSSDLLRQGWDRACPDEQLPVRLPET